MEDSPKLNGQLNRLSRLELLKTIAMVFMAVSLVILAIAGLILARSNHLMEERLSCRGEANEVIQSAIGRGFVAAINQDQAGVEQQGERIQEGVQMLEDCN